MRHVFSFTKSNKPTRLSAFTHPMNVMKNTDLASTVYILFNKYVIYLLVKLSDCEETKDISSVFYIINSKTNQNKSAV